MPSEVWIRKVEVTQVRKVDAIARNRGGLNGRRVENRELDDFGEGAVLVFHVQFNDMGIRERVACIANHGQPEIIGLEQSGSQLPSVGPADEVSVRTRVQHRDGGMTVTMAILKPDLRCRPNGRRPPVTDGENSSETPVGRGATRSGGLGR